MLALLIEVLARANSKPICSGCGCPGPCYDTLEPRKFEFVPLWNIAVFFMYAMRRVNCKRCEVKVEIVPWADGKHTLTKTYMHFPADNVVVGNCLLDAKNDITLSSLQRAAAIVGRRLTIELI